MKNSKILTMKNVHETADVQSVNIGKDTKIWQYCVILEGAVIGQNCNINFNVFIENDVIIGNDVTIKPGVQIWDGIEIEDDVFIGPNVTFTNDCIPRSKKYSADWKQDPERWKKTLVRKGASIGANATVLAGCTIGRDSLIGAGSVVTKDVFDNTVWYGNPAKLMGYITNRGLLLDVNMMSKCGKKYSLEEIKNDD